MLRTLQAAVGLILVAGILAPAQSREWKDKSGKYKIEADLIGFDDETVILQRDNKELGACKIEELCEEDQVYLKSKEAKQIHTGRIDQMQTWTTASGLKVRGKIVDYADKVITIQRRRGKIYIDDQVYTNLPGIYQQMLPKIVSHFESIQVADAAAFERWVKALLGFSKTYRLQGVILELENGDEYGVPFFLLSEKDLQILKPGWESWLQAHEDPSTGQNPDDESFRLQSLAAAYQQDQKINQQIAIMNLNMQAIQSGLTSAWEVSLYPAAGYNYRPRWVVVMARNSLDATQMALRQNPGYRDGPVRRVSN
jgi:hypothetical protein